MFGERRVDRAGELRLDEWLDPDPALAEQPVGDLRVATSGVQCTRHADQPEPIDADGVGIELVVEPALRFVPAPEVDQGIDQVAGDEPAVAPRGTDGTRPGDALSRDVDALLRPARDHERRAQVRVDATHVVVGIGQCLRPLERLVEHGEALGRPPDEDRARAERRQCVCLGLRGPGQPSEADRRLCGRYRLALVAAKHPGTGKRGDDPGSRRCRFRCLRARRPWPPGSTRPSVVAPEPHDVRASRSLARIQRSGSRVRSIE